MLNPFPIQFLAPLAYFILRVLYGLYLLRLTTRGRDAIEQIPTLPRNVRALYYAITIITGLASLSLILGYGTQIGALVSGIIALMHMRKDAHDYFPIVMPHSTAFLSLAASLALFITGAGAFAFDLPI